MKNLLATTIIFCGIIITVDPGFALTLTKTSAPTNYWNSIAASADGSKLAGVVYGGGIYTSTNAGVNWSLTSAPSGFPWESIAMSVDGTKLVAVGFYRNPIYLSTNFGVNWVTNGPSEDWQTVACSSDGNKIVAAAYINEPIFTSTNFGADWIQATNASNNWWQSVASSSDGIKLIAAVGGLETAGPIFFSTNSGATWVATSAPNLAWISIASSADGTKLVAASQMYPAVGGSIYTSTNSGMTWISNNVPSEPWSSVVSSASGDKLMAVAYNYTFDSRYGGTYSGGVFTSSNGGANWIQIMGPSNYWYSAATSVDGNKLLVAVNNGGIWNSQTMPPSPQLNLHTASNNLAFSWKVASPTFALQQKLNLTNKNWVTLANIPTLNFSNLNNELSLSPTNSSGFFRLISQ